MVELPRRRSRSRDAASMDRSAGARATRRARDAVTAVRHGDDGGAVREAGIPGAGARRSTSCSSRRRRRASVCASASLRSQARRAPAVRAPRCGEFFHGSPARRARGDRGASHRTRARQRTTSRRSSRSRTRARRPAREAARPRRDCARSERLRDRVRRSASTAAHPRRARNARRARGSIDALFGKRPTARRTSAASALAQAFGGTESEAPPITGRPRARRLVSCRSTACSATGPRGRPAARRASRSTSSSPRAPGRRPEPGPRRRRRREPARRRAGRANADDIEQFNSWLQGLKQR